jgi:hypothetical protein
MAVIDQCLTDKFALYNGDCVEVMSGIPDGKIHLSVYSPPFAGLYHYSSDERDLSNCDSYDDFLTHYGFVVRELARITMPGRITAVHCMDIPRTNNGSDRLLDFPGDIIRLHEREGWSFTGRRMIWKEPLGVRMRTMQKSLAHAALVEDSIDCGVASGDQLLTFRRSGENPVPVAHPVGMLEYSGSRVPPADILPFRGHTGKQTENRFSHWIWRQYASCIWDDVREKRVLPYREARDSDDEKHLHPLQLDVIDRCVALFSNPGETVFTPFMGVGSEVFSPLLMGRRAMGTELKPSYYRQAVKNAKLAAAGRKDTVVNETLDFGADDHL